MRTALRDAAGHPNPSLHFCPLRPAGRPRPASPKAPQTLRQCLNAGLDAALGAE